MRSNLVLSIVTLMALSQLPISIVFILGGQHRRVAQAPKPPNPKVSVEERKQPEPMLPYRADPFVPFPGDRPAGIASADQGQTNDQVAMSQALSGTTEGANPVNANAVQPSVKAAIKPLPSPAELLKNLPKLPPRPVAVRPAAPATRLQAVVAAKPTLAPKLQGIVLCQGFRVALFEMEPGRVVRIRPYERIPETVYAAKGIRDDGVFVVDTSEKDRQFRYVPVGRTVVDPL